LKKFFLNFLAFIGVIVGIAMGFLGVALTMNTYPKTQIIGGTLIIFGLALSFLSGWSNHKLNKEG